MAPHRSRARGPLRCPLVEYAASGDGAELAAHQVGHRGDPERRGGCAPVDVPARPDVTGAELVLEKPEEPLDDRVPGIRPLRADVSAAATREVGVDGGSGPGALVV